MNAVAEAVILMAGTGSRLRGNDATFLKPLVPLLKRPLVSYTLDALVRAGIRKVHIIVGYQSARMIAGIEPLRPAGLEFSFVENRDWQKQNGISLLAARKHVSAPFVLTMSDHIFDPLVVDLLIKSADRELLNVAADRKLDSIFDLDDAMKVQTRGNNIVAIGKDLRDYDAIDTGLFICPMETFAYFDQARKNDDCSLADGMRLMAADNKVRAVDIGDAWWQDVDTPEMLKHAAEMIAEKPGAQRAAK